MNFFFFFNAFFDYFRVHLDQFYYNYEHLPSAIRWIRTAQIHVKLLFEIIYDTGQDDCLGFTAKVHHDQVRFVFR